MRDIWVLSQVICLERGSQGQVEKVDRNEAVFFQLFHYGKRPEHQEKPRMFEADCRATVILFPRNVLSFSEMG